MQGDPSCSRIILNLSVQYGLMPAPLKDQLIDKIQKDVPMFHANAAKVSLFPVRTHFLVPVQQQKMFLSISVRLSPAKSRISCRKTTLMHLRCRLREGG